MKMTITKEDVRKLNGHLIIEINDSDEDLFELKEENWQFYKEKRISFICGLEWVGFYYKHSICSDLQDFVDTFNPSNGRFRRLLTSKEIDFMCKKLKEENY
jgi:hypothetical protein